MAPGSIPPPLRCHSDGEREGDWGELEECGQGKEEATTAPGGLDVSLTEIEYIEQVLRATGSPKLCTSV